MKILLIKTSALGDVVQTFPVVSYLRKRFPAASIDWVVEARAAELVIAHPEVNRCLILDSRCWRRAPWKSRHAYTAFFHALRQESYELAVDLQGNCKSALLLASARAAMTVGFGWKTVPEWPNALATRYKVDSPPHQTIQEDYLALVKQYYADDVPFVIPTLSLKLKPSEEALVKDVLSDATMVAPHAHWRNKELSLDQLRRFLQQIDRGPYLFVCGREAARGEVAQLAAAFPNSCLLPPCTLPVLQQIMARSRLLIAMDSLLLHLCATTGTPTIGFFGPSLAAKYRPIGASSVAIQGSCPYGVSFSKRCPYLRTCASGACLKALSVDSMVEPLHAP